MIGAVVAVRVTGGFLPEFIASLHTSRSSESFLLKDRSIISNLKFETFILGVINDFFLSIFSMIVYCF